MRGGRNAVGIGGVNRPQLLAYVFIGLDLLNAYARELDGEFEPFLRSFGFQGCEPDVGHIAFSFQVVLQAGSHSSRRGVKPSAPLAF